jgi:hypothetical protein
MFRPDLVLSGVKPYGLTILQASEHVAQPLTSITAKEVFVTGVGPRNGSAPARTSRPPTLTFHSTRREQ